MNRLEGKVALVTGAAQGIGEAIARLFAEEGATVVLGDVNDERGTTVVSQLREAGRAATFAHLDVRDPGSWSSVVDAVSATHGRIDVLVNNAGVGSEASVVDENVATWTRIVDINQKGVWLGMRAVIPVMQRNRSGSIVNICSIMGVAGDIDHMSYQATKGAVRMLSKNAALSYVSDGIRCNTVCPGMVETEMSHEEDPAVLEEWLGDTPMRRQGTTREVALGALFLASDDASYITGIDLVIDGGYLAR